MKKTLSAIPKNCSIYLLIIFASMLLLVKLSGQPLLIDRVKTNYRQIFRGQYEDALQFINDNSWMADSLKSKGIDPDFALAIIFPELIRYSSLRNKMEVSGLLTLYVQYGEKYADFSVGHFQMKPTFAEQLERDIIKNPVEPFPKFDLSNTPKARIERVNRLNDINWQLNYLSHFFKVMERKYEHIQWNCKLDKLKFYATAYNSGYSLGEVKIKNHINSNMFYTGFSKGDSCYCYSEIACDYYLLFE